MATLAPSVEHRFSLFLCDHLAALVPSGVQFLPEHGQGLQLGASPYCVPLIESCDQVNPPYEVYMLHINLTLQSMPDDTDPATHSDLVRQVKAALEGLRKTCPVFDEARAIYVNGMAVMGVRPIVSESAHTTAIELRAGCQLR